MREGLLHPPSYRHLAYKETMRHRWANTSLLLLVLAEVATGAFGLAAGASNRAFLNDLHAIFSFGIAATIRTRFAQRSYRGQAAVGSQKSHASTPVVLTGRWRIILESKRTYAYMNQSAREPHRLLCGASGVCSRGTYRQNRPSER